MRTVFSLVTLLALAACTDATNPDDLDEGEVITTVRLSFTPQGGGDALTFEWSDPEADGDPVIDPITLSDAVDYDLSVAFLDEMQDPAEDITEEIGDEAEEHQVFFTGTAVAGPASASASAVVTHAYADEDANGLPVGLVDTIATDAAGSGTLTVTLRHLPPESGTAVKVAGLAEQVATDGFGALPGDTDAQVEFALEVTP